MTQASRTQADRVAALQTGEDTELNMTPMIDIVFQLIIFFMLTLKFKEIDRRIDSAMPKHRGLEATQIQLEEKPKIKVKVFRRNMRESEDKHYTLVKIDNTHQYRLPTGWRGYAKEAALAGSAQSPRVAAYKGALDKIYAVIAHKLRVHPGPQGEMTGEIVAPTPVGGSVPHGDVMAMLDIFLRNGVTDVMFEGQKQPLRAAR